MVFTPVLQSSAAESLAFCAVPPDEIGFAIALFMGAANSQVAVRSSFGAFHETPDFGVSRRLFAELSAGHSAPPGRSRPASYLPSLYQAYATVWEHYGSDDMRASICARVLSFYYLMERTEGAAIAHWVSDCPGSPEVVDLHPAIVEALATVPLSDEGTMPEELFLTMIERIASCGTSQGFTRH